MFGVDINKFSPEQQKIIETISLFNSDTNYVMFCTEEMKEKLKPLISEYRLDDVKVTKLVEGAVVMNKDALKYKTERWQCNDIDCRKQD